MEKKELYPYLCMGIFFDLLNNIKSPSRSKREKKEGKKGKVTETGLMWELCYALTNDDLYHSLKGKGGSALTAIKQCTANCKGDLGFEKNGKIAQSFLYNIEHDYSGVVQRFTTFFEETISHDKCQIESFFKQLIWIIKEDSTIDTKVKFKTTFSETGIVPKERIDKINYLEIQPFIISVLRYILTQTCNTNGNETFKKWFKQSGDRRQSEYFFIAPTEANSIHHLNVVLYNLTEKPDQATNESSIISVATEKTQSAGSGVLKTEDTSAYEITTIKGELGKSYPHIETRSKSSRSVDHLELSLQQLVAAKSFAQFKAARLRLFQAIKIFVNDIKFPYVRNIDDYDDDSWEKERQYYEDWLFRVLNYCMAEIEVTEQSDELTDVKISLLYDIMEWHFLSAMLRAQLDIEQLAFELSGEAIGKETKQTRIRKLREKYQIAQSDASLSEVSLDEKISGYENDLSADKTSL